MKHAWNPKEFIRATGISRATYNDWRNRNFIQKSDTKGNVSIYFKRDVVKCMIMLSLKEQGISLPNANKVAEELVKSGIWEYTNVYVFKGKDNKLSIYSSPPNTPSALYMNLEPLRSKLKSENTH